MPATGAATAPLTALAPVLAEIRRSLGSHQAYRPVGEVLDDEAEGSPAGTDMAGAEAPADPPRMAPATGPQAMVLGDSPGRCHPAGRMSEK